MFSSILASFANPARYQSSFMNPNQEPNLNSFSWGPEVHKKVRITEWVIQVSNLNVSNSQDMLSCADYSR